MVMASVHEIAERLAISISRAPRAVPKALGIVLEAERCRIRRRSTSVGCRPICARWSAVRHSFMTSPPAAAPSITAAIQSTLSGRASLRPRVGAFGRMRRGAPSARRARQARPRHTWAGDRTLTSAYSGPRRARRPRGSPPPPWRESEMPRPHTKHIRCRVPWGGASPPERLACPPQDTALASSARYAASTWVTGATIEWSTRGSFREHGAARWSFRATQCKCAIAYSAATRHGSVDPGFTSVEKARIGIARVRSGRTTPDGSTRTCWQPGPARPVRRSPPVSGERGEGRKQEQRDTAVRRYVCRIARDEGITHHQLARRRFAPFSSRYGTPPSQKIDDLPDRPSCRWRFRSRPHSAAVDSHYRAEGHRCRWFRPRCPGPLSTTSSANVA